MPEKWDKEAEVVIIGFGGAGAAAAIAAADEGASVILLEKAPEGEEGGNTRVSGNMWFCPSPVEPAITYFNAMSGPFTAPPEMVRVWAEEMGKGNDWVTSIGGEVGELNIFNPEFPELPGNESAKTFANPTAMQSKLWKLLKANVDERDIEVLYGTPAMELVQIPDTKEILGVIAEQNGQSLAIKASKGVIMTCGGFENNQEMIRDYLHWEEGYPKGTPYNTGDGVKMAIAVGADLWHMCNVAGPDWNLKVDEFDFAFGYSLYPRAAKSWFVVGADDKRFIDDKTGTRHGKVLLNGKFQPLPLPLPVHMIFDEKVMTGGPLYYNSEMFSWYSVVEAYRWSDDNMVELDKGWFVKADTIRELAEKIDRDPDALEATLNRYNEACETGVDTEFGTTAENLVALEAPFYAMKLVPTFTNTQGGARRNERSQIVDTEGNPIPRLYSAGEFGSIYGDLYNGGGNVAECMAFGQLAARNAVAEEAWD
jgi:succinate dehydrogenase/fumarate reductase flavoprotein subunit